MIPLTDARIVAETVRRRLAPFCDRIEVAGSIRRERAEVKDVEICAISKTGWRIEEGSLFGESESKPFALLEAYLQSEVQNTDDRLLWWQMNEHGNRAGDGPRYKRLQINPDYVPHRWPDVPTVNLDLFIAQEDNFGNVYAIRTGHRHFSEGAMWAAQRQGLKQSGGFLWRGEDKVLCLEESDFFRLLNLPLLPPQERTLEAIQKLVPGFVPREIREQSDPTRAAA